MNRDREGGGKRELVVKAFDGAEVGADEGDLGGGVGGGAANAGAVLVVIRDCGRDEGSLEVVGVDELIGRHRHRLLGRSYLWTGEFFFVSSSSSAGCSGLRLMREEDDRRRRGDWLSGPREHVPPCIHENGSCPLG